LLFGSQARKEAEEKAKKEAEEKPSTLSEMTETQPTENCLN
jgi:hypothetical protein